MRREGGDGKDRIFSKSGVRRKLRPRNGSWKIVTKYAAAKINSRQDNIRAGA